MSTYAYDPPRPAQVEPFRLNVSARQAHCDAAADGVRLPDINELYTGQPLYADDVAQDAAMFARQQAEADLREGAAVLPEDVRDHLVAVVASTEPARLRALHDCLLPHVQDARYSEAYRTRLRHIVERVDLWMATLGDAGAALRVALAAFDDIEARQFEGSSASQLGRWVLMLRGLQIASRIETLAGRYTHRAGRTRDLDDEAASLLAGLGKMIAMLQPGADPAGANESTPSETFVFDPLDLGDEFAPPPATPAAPEPRTEPPGVVVIRSDLSHLPGAPPREGKGAFGQTPKAEFGVMARKRIPLALTPDMHAVGGALRARAPWAWSVTETLLLDSAASATVRLRPTVLVGEPGAGKSWLARSIADGLGVPSYVFPCAGVSDAAFAGTSRQWGSGRPSVPLLKTKEHGVANHLIVLDELEKASPSRHNGNLPESLLGFLDPGNAARFADQYLESEVDLSHVLYVVTVNSLSGLPQPLLDRCRVIRMPAPRSEDLDVLAPALVADIRAARGLPEWTVPDLDLMELDALRRHWKGGSVRRLQALVAGVLDARSRGLGRAN